MMKEEEEEEEVEEEEAKELRRSFSTSLRGIRQRREECIR